MIASKVNGAAYAACRAHLGVALDKVTGPDSKSADVRVMNVKGMKGPEGLLKYVCGCKKPATFYVFEVEERPELVASRPETVKRETMYRPAQPEAGAPFSPCTKRLNGVHHYACVTCGDKPNDW